jgi:hypothetical protein
MDDSGEFEGIIDKELHNKKSHNWKAYSTAYYT